jgi:hypothetical protein
MRRMSREVLSTARPAPLRLAGFLLVALGAIGAGIGATRVWAAIGFPGDALGAADVPVHGTDVWEGKLILLAVAIALFALLGMRLAAADTTRRALALAIVAVGLVSAVLPVFDAARAEDRFGGAGGIDRLAESIAAATGQEVEIVRDVLTEEFQRNLRVDVEAWPWVTAAGGVLLVAGGVLGLVWIRRRAGQAPTAGQTPTAAAAS